MITDEGRARVCLDSNRTTMTLFGQWMTISWRGVIACHLQATKNSLSGRSKQNRSRDSTRISFEAFKIGPLVRPIFLHRSITINSLPTLESENKTLSHEKFDCPLISDSISNHGIFKFAPFLLYSTYSYHNGRIRTMIILVIEISRSRVFKKINILRCLIVWWYKKYCAVLWGYKIYIKIIYKIKNK